MKWFGIFSIFSDSPSLSDTSMSTPVINPANGLPMQNGVGGFDVAGNLFGHDTHQNDWVNPSTNYTPPTDW